VFYSLWCLHAGVISDFFSGDIDHTNMQMQWGYVAMRHKLWRLSKWNKANSIFKDLITMCSN